MGPIGPDCALRQREHKGEGKSEETTGRVRRQRRDNSRSERANRVEW
jgi:hypothetical protein